MIPTDRVCISQEDKEHTYGLDNDRCATHWWYVLFFLDASIIDDGNCRQITANVGLVTTMQKEVKGRIRTRDDHGCGRVRYMQQCMHRRYHDAISINR